MVVYTRGNQRRREGGRGGAVKRWEREREMGGGERWEREKEGGRQREGEEGREEDTKHIFVTLITVYVYQIQ